MDRRKFLALGGIGLLGAAATVVAVELPDAGGESDPPPPGRVAANPALGGGFGGGSGPAPGSGRAGGVTVGGVALRPPAVPLAVRSPYTSAWLRGTELAGSDAIGWNGSPMPMCGLVRIDGRSYTWCGDPGTTGIESLHQQALEVTPTRSTFVFEAGGVRLVAEWLSPVEPGDPRLQSVPLGLVSLGVVAVDGRTHAVQTYLDISGYWASWDASDAIIWQTSKTRSRHWTVELANPQLLVEHDEMAAWGAAVLSTTAGGAESYQSGDASTVRSRFTDAGRLDDTVDQLFRPIDDDMPVFALARDLGVVSPAGASTELCLGHFERHAAIEYRGEPLKPLWTSHWASWQEMVDDFLLHGTDARERAAALDERITAAATQAGGGTCAALCALSLRQAYGACQLATGPEGRPWAFLKEISSDDDISTVDIIFASSPVWLALDPGYLTMLLEPVLFYASSPEWRSASPPHSLGTWPIASGNPVGPSSEPMPMQESGGMLVMMAALARTAPVGTRELLSRYELEWTRWAELLVSQLPVPPRQLTTIDYFGSLKGDVNLAALGIVGLGAAAQIAAAAGHAKMAATWARKASGFADRWTKLATDRSGRHLETEIGSPGGWSSLPNAYWDRVLSTNLLPERVARMQAAWYESHLDHYGMALVSTWPTLSRVDKTLWTAAWLKGEPVGQKLVDLVSRYAGHTSLLAPFPDTYDPVTGGPLPKYNWQARPVVGGVFSLLTLPD